MKVMNRNQKKILQELENNPLVERACRKVGIARSTYYRWCKSDGNFRTIAEQSQEQGRGKMNDFAESKLLENVSNNQQPAINFWLSHNTSRYRAPNNQYQALQTENMKRGLWFRIEMMNRLIDAMGTERFLKLVNQPTNEDLLADIERAYEQDRINKGFRNKRGNWQSEDVYLPYPDDMDFTI
jgi:hypothetical protein